MLPELATFSIILALAFSLLQFMSGKYAIAIASACNQFIFLTLAMLCLMISFLINDFSLNYVLDHSHTLLPIIYRIGAIWAGHEGSLLLWCLILSGWTLAFILFRDQRLENFLLTKIISSLGLISSGFIAFLLLTSNPFKRTFPTQWVAGNDLTPVLQDPGLIFHPPLLYLGYVGFAVPFAFAAAALLTKQINHHWTASLRPWVVLPWGLLSGGIVLGSWWAYRELGWGGWWFWDPVENASLLPWLSATALLHSLKIVEKQQAFARWAIFLAIMTFALSLIGTFLVRSGVLVSVHSFAGDPTRGLFLFILLGLLIGGMLILFVLRYQNFYRPSTFHLISRETFLLINSIILIIAVFAILVGTIYPIIFETIKLKKIAIGETYFNTVFLVIMLPALALMGIAPHVKWQQHNVKSLFTNLRVPLLISLVFSIVVPWTLGVFLAMWIIISTVIAWWRQPKILRRNAMLIAHLGIAILVLGITLNKTYSDERQIKMVPGETATLAGYNFTFKTISENQGTNFQSISALFAVSKHNKKEQYITAEQRLYSNNQALSKTGILFNSWRDLYLVLGPPLPNGKWDIRIYYQPFVRWIWCGGFLLLMGGVLAL